MRLPSDAQARLLSIVETEQPVFLSGRSLWKRGTPTIFGGNGVEGEGLEGRAHFPRGGCSTASTADRCFAEGWLVRVPRHDLPQDGDLVTEISSDGRIALGLWRQRRMARPPAPEPVLHGDDLAVVQLAERAMRLGYKLAPETAAAKAQARRLRREGWVLRGFIGKSTSSVEPTAMALVAVNPAAADGRGVGAERDTGGEEQ